MKKLPLLLLCVTTFAVSCKNSKNTESNTRTAPEAVASLPATQGTDVSADAAPQIATAGNTEAGQKPALNPAHGEPYHRCDIEVGAPLNSPAAPQTPVPQMSQQAPANGGFNTNPIAPSVSPSPSVSSSAATGPKPALNPAHGEPHHRCDLQVGAPLT